MIGYSTKVYSHFYALEIMHNVENTISFDKRRQCGQKKAALKRVLTFQHVTRKSTKETVFQCVINGGCN